MAFHRVLRTIVSGAVVCFITMASTSCDRINKAAEDRDPNIKRARALRAVGDYTGAIDSYEKALVKRPKSARTHWEMASIYDLELTNDLRAIYHYERFLEIDPKAERKQYAEQLIAAAKLQYAISLPDRFSDAVDENARLKKEIETLRALLTEARNENALLSGREVSEAAVSQPGSREPILEPAVAIASSLESYVVQPGDTLSRIASKFYGDPNKWNVIFEANKSLLRRPESVRVGQTLVIPK